jgi:hypothetical protein
MKVYVHFEGDGGGDKLEFTWIWIQKDNEGDLSVRKLVVGFISVFNANFSNTPLDISAVKVTRDGEKIDMSDEVPHVLEDRDDLFVVGKTGKPIKPTAAPTPPVRPPAVSANPASTSPAMQEIYTANFGQVKQLLDIVAGKRYRHLAAVCTEFLGSSFAEAPTGSLVHDVVKLPYATVLVHAHLTTGRFKAADDLIRKYMTPAFTRHLGKANAESPAATVGPREKGLLLTYQLLSVCFTIELLFNIKKYDACIKYSQSNQKLVEASLKTLEVFYGKAANQATEGYLLLRLRFLPDPAVQRRMNLVTHSDQSKAPFMEMCKKLIPMNIASIQANCLFYQGKDQESVNIVNALMVPAEQSMHVPLLLSYCQIALKYSKVDECVASLLRCITVDPDNHSLHRVLLGCLTADTPQVQMVGSGGATAKQYFPTLSKYLPMNASPKNTAANYVVPSFLSAFGFLANICKQYSKVYLAVDLYRTKIFEFYQVSTTDGPVPMNFILNYIHVLEISNNYCFILSECVRYMERYHANSGTYGVSTSLKELLGSFLTVLKGEHTNSERKYYGIHWSSDTDSDITEGTCAYTESRCEVFELMPATTGSDGVVFTAGNFICDGVDTGARFAPGGVSNVVALNSEIRKYSEEDLDVLAICFTVIKLIFLYCGNNGGSSPQQTPSAGSSAEPCAYVPSSSYLIHVLPLLYSHMERYRVQSAVPLHSSTIRNEHAYYLAIGHLLSVATRSSMGLARVCGDLERSCLYSPRSLFNANSRKQDVSSSSQSMGRHIYVCGDSHTLSLSHYTSGSIRFIPKLVTGIKHYHLWGESIDRQYTHGKDMSTLSELLHVVKGHDASHGPDPAAPGTATGNSKFYTKANFYHFMEEIPDGSEVMFLIGEIDCREGILKAVEQGKHDSLDEAIRINIREFLRVLKDVMRRKRIRPFIHPALPVLDETRHIVLQYNRVYKEMASEIPGVKFLDFVAELLEPAPQKRPQVEELDGGGGSSDVASADAVETTFVLKAPYVLDGTHIHPRYMDVLVRGL